MPKALSICLALLLLAAALPSQSVDALQFGVLAIHDHIAFNYHIPIKNDPFPHQVKEGYAFDGADAIAALHWHWGATRLVTALRVTPASRTHFAYDQDTDFMSGNDFTHGNEGFARSRTFGLDQSFSLSPHLSTDLGFLRQWTRYHQVTTYDLNTNPALPSNIVQRLISERAVVYELRPGLVWTERRQVGAWSTGAAFSVSPISEIFLRNYIPVVLAATSLSAYGGTATIATTRPFGSWKAELGASAGWYQNYGRAYGFRRQEFSLRLALSPSLIGTR